MGGTALDVSAVRDDRSLDVIFATLGTHGQPMERLTEALGQVSRELPSLAPFLIQHGATQCPQGWDGEEFLAPPRMQEYVAAADIVITHGGPATIEHVRASRKIPVVVPRRARFGEHVDDHQVWYCRKLSDAREIILIYDADELLLKLAKYRELAQSLPAASAHDPALAVIAFRTLIHTMDSEE